ncbi:MAG: carbohydrate ABC transporter permease [Aggregatilineales bacterium]
MNTRALNSLTPGGIIARGALIFMVLVWTLPTVGLLISSLREKDQLLVTGWWTALQTAERNLQGRTGAAGDQVQNDDGMYVISGTVFEEESGSQRISTYGGGFLPASGTVEYEPGEQVGLSDYSADEVVALEDGTTFTLNSDGTYEWVSPEPFELERGVRFFATVSVPPSFSLNNYDEVLSANNFDQSFINTFVVAVPSTIIPIAIAAFASYAFSWMEFPGRQLLFVIVVGLLVVPLQMSLIPLLRLYNTVGSTFGIDAKSYPGIWLAHTGFGLPLAIYLLRNYIGGLPREIIESAKIDGASHFDIFVRLVLPLSIPALASFAIFQFLWVWNDLLIALVFLNRTEDQSVMTVKMGELLGSRGDNWQVLTSSAFISILVPLIVFFSLQRYFVRGLLAGSVKGG